MPLEEIRAVIEAPSVQHRNDLIAGHLDQLERALETTAEAVSSLRDLLTADTATAEVTYRRTPEVPAAVISGTLELGQASAWFHGAIGELFATLAAQGRRPVGPPGGIYGVELFATGRGPATVFVPVREEPVAVGRVRSDVVAAAELAVIVHHGAHGDVDRSYGALAAHVARHALAIDGPTRENYLVGLHNSSDEAAWETEICWPIFLTAGADRDGTGDASTLDAQKPLAPGAAAGYK
jgi:effector-binding domain-containing protein